MSFEKEQKIIFDLLKDIKDNQEILYCYDSFIINPLYADKMCKINCRKTNISQNYKCIECNSNGNKINNSQITLLTHNNTCTRPAYIKKIKKIITNPFYIPIISDKELSFLPESHYDNFIIGKSYGYYEKPDNIYNKLGRLDKIIDKNSGPSEDPIELFFTNGIITYEFFTDKENIKFVEITEINNK